MEGRKKWGNLGMKGMVFISKGHLLHTWGDRPRQQLKKCERAEKKKKKKKKTPRAAWERD